MVVSYKKLWHILLDRDIKKKELAEKAGITQYTMKKLNKNESVGTETIGKICCFLGCTADDIMEFGQANDCFQERSQENRECP